METGRERQIQRHWIGRESTIDRNSGFFGPYWKSLLTKLWILVEKSSQNFQLDNVLFRVQSPVVEMGSPTQVGSRNLYTGPQGKTMAECLSDFYLLLKDVCQVTRYEVACVYAHALWREIREGLIVKIIAKSPPYFRQYRYISRSKLPDVSTSVDPASFPDKTADNERGLL